MENNPPDELTGTAVTLANMEARAPRSAAPVEEAS
jgi:hypothetical protein